jgi:hypothetical protein
MPMDKIINYLLLTIIFVFDPLAIALVIAANFAFARLRKPTKENLYGEVIEIDGAEGMKVECSVPEGKEFNTPYDISDIIEDEKKEEIKEEIEKIQEKIKNVERAGWRGRALENRTQPLKDKIKKLKKDDNENQITY